MKREGGQIYTEDYFGSLRE